MNSKLLFAIAGTAAVALSVYGITLLSEEDDLSKYGNSHIFNGDDAGQYEK